MSVSTEFVTHALDLLAPLGLVEAKRMFGGYGVYARGVMFAILDDEELFLKADDEAQATFVAAGCRQWSYPTKAGPQPGPYWRPPDEAHEDPEAMRPWAALGLQAALRKAAAKAMKGAGKKAKAAPEAKAAPKAKTTSRPKTRATVKAKPAPKARPKPMAPARKAAARPAAKARKAPARRR